MLQNNKFPFELPLLVFKGKSQYKAQSNRNYQLVVQLLISLVVCLLSVYQELKPLLTQLVQAYQLLHHIQLKYNLIIFNKYSGLNSHHGNLSSTHSSIQIRFNNDFSSFPDRDFVFKLKSISGVEKQFVFNVSYIVLYLLFRAQDTVFSYKRSFNNISFSVHYVQTTLQIHTQIFSINNLKILATLIFHISGNLFLSRKRSEICWQKI